MLSVDVVLFDLGNTLFYDNAAVWPRVYQRAEAALWRSLQKSGINVDPSVLYGKPDTLLHHYYALRGNGILEPGTFTVLKGFFEHRNIPVSEVVLEQALRAMYRVTQSNWRVERDAAATLRALLERGFLLGAVSNGSDHKNALELLDKARLRGAFEFVLTSAAHGRRKPDASIFMAALDHFRVEAPQVVMIGDSYHADIVGGQGVGLQTIWITRRAGPPPPDMPVRPDATINALREILALLLHPAVPHQGRL